MRLFRLTTDLINGGGSALPLHEHHPSKRIHALKWDTALDVLGLRWRSLEHVAWMWSALVRIGS